ncbi:retrovirus-related pol polyprotein from transposon TNT 1-94 [Tanacetum coccineum]
MRRLVSLTKQTEARTPQQKGVNENKSYTNETSSATNVDYAKALLFLWAEAVATACYTQNRSIIRLRHGKTPYELLHDKLPDIIFLPCNWSNSAIQPNDMKFGKQIIETIHVNFDELTAMASEHSSSGPALHEMTPATISSGLVPNPPPSTPFVPPSRTDWDMLFQPLFDELLNPPPSVDHPAPEVIAPIDEVAAPVPAVSTTSPPPTIFDQDHHQQSQRHLIIIKISLEILKKYSFDSCDLVDTPMVEKSKLDEDKEGKAIDPSHYRGMIGTLLNLTAHRPTSNFYSNVCPDSSIALTAFANADHAGCPRYIDRIEFSYHKLGMHSFTAETLKHLADEVDEVVRHLTNQAMLWESEAFKTYHAYATGEKAPKSKATKKKTDSESSPKTKPSQACKGKRIKTLAKGDKPTTTNGSSDGVDILSKVPDEQQQTRSGTNEGAGEDEEEDKEHDNDDNDDKDDDQENDSQKTKSDDEGDDFVHPNLSTYIADDQEKEKEKEKADDDDDDVTSDQKVSTPPDYEFMEEDENKQDDDTIGEEQGDEDNGELYGDLNINLSRSDAKMTDA